MSSTPLLSPVAASGLALEDEDLKLDAHEMELAIQMNSDLLAEDVVRDIAESFLEEDHVVAIEKIPSQFSKVATATHGLLKWTTAHENCQAICEATEALVAMKEKAHTFAKAALDSDTKDITEEALHILAEYYASLLTVAEVERKKKAKDCIPPPPSPLPQDGVHPRGQHQLVGVLDSSGQRDIGGDSGARTTRANSGVHSRPARDLPRSISH
jgi:hypothetical protein